MASVRRKSNPERNKALKVAQFANPSVRGNQTKAAIALDARRADYSRMVDNRDFKAPEGAYHRPGSMQGPR